MKTYNWIVIGGGITGAALSYELVKKGFSVLLLEKDATPENATRYSYGGLAYWSGTTELTRQLCQEGIELHRNLSEELEADTEFRELDLVLTIDPEDDPQVVADSYSQFAIPPRLLSVEEACELEPLLNPKAIASVLRLPHGHIHPQKTTQGYQQIFRRAGGEIKIAQVVKLLRKGDRIEGVKTPNQTYHAANTVVCAGGLSRSLLKEARINLRLYFTHAQLIRTPPVDIKLRTLVMPATLKRLTLEAEASKAEIESIWDKPGYEPVPGILEPGAIQFLDGSLCIGQISQVLTDPEAEINATASERQIRKGIGRILPSLENVPGTWNRCLVAFANNSHPLVGAINNLAGVYLFSGFTSTLVFAPPLAKHFANWVAGEEDDIIPQLSPVG
ncbi:MAG: NAD(P)/FAD-dependent oxidoreductase [Xenococcaceae cyanobacterium]